VYAAGVTEAQAWQIWVDTGGTFTDCLALDPAGAWHRVKVLSSGALRGRVADQASGRRLLVEHNWPSTMSPHALTGLVCGAARRGASATVESFDPIRSELTLSRPVALEPGATFEVRGAEPVPVLAARLVTGTPAGAPLPPHRLRLATTLGTNALLQRRGSALALFVSAGFADLLRIGTQQRPDLFALEIRRPAPLPAAVVEVQGRIAADGAELAPLDEAALRREARAILGRGIDCAALALAHSYRNPTHEARAARLLRGLGFAHVSCSAELSPLIALLPRAETAVVNAYLAPLVGGFFERITRVSGGAPLVMSSAGGLMRADRFAPKDSLLSGPAGGVVGAALIGRRAGLERVISFDMGGTSTDVARFDGEHDYRFHQQVGEVHLATPALAIETVAAGGGSICAVDAQGALVVGPESAGAEPGPACYGAGGPLTITDVNLLLGRLDPTRFRIPVEPGLARAALTALRTRQADAAAREAEDEDRLLEGLLALANERMADAIRQVSVRRGYDPRDYALVAFGGAGPQHACGVADRLGMETVLVPADAGLLSALGLGHAEVERFATRQVLRGLGEVEGELAGWLEELAAEARALLNEEGVPAAQSRVRRRLVNLRLLGQDSALTLDCPSGVDPGALAARFGDRFAALYGYSPPADRPIEVESIRVVASSSAGRSAEAPAPRGEERTEPGRLTARFGGQWREVPCLEREQLVAGQVIEAPAVIMDRHSTTVLETGWRATVHESATLVLRRTTAAPSSTLEAPAAVQLELFIGRLGSIVAEMGELLRRTALSTNIKERLDYSCALLDRQGGLVLNAPHIPVHLGSLGLCVRRVVATLPLGPGDVALTNHPAFGGSHLPDVTLITPAFAGQTLLGYLASRAHHAEIGGSTPGSMPPRARCLAEEGVVIAPFKLLEAGRPRWDELARRLREAPHPSRAVEDNLADLAAQLAANRLGARALEALAAEHGANALQGWMDDLKDRAERQIRAALAALPDGEHRARDSLDDGTPLGVVVTIDGESARIAFEAGAAHPGNLNATPAVVRGVVIYVLRLLVRRPLPLNEGLMRAVALTIPPGILDPPFPDDPRRAPAVVGGNVETSQRLVDLLLRALGLAACSQGTMNNLVFGNERFGYYETVGGGAGAGPDFCGASGVHTHMTNTRITDVEVLEQRYPVRVERFAIRAGSGGRGARRGGDGLVRELTFLEPVELSILSQRRTTRPCGLDGGEPGAPGRQRLLRRDGSVLELSPVDGCAAEPGDRLLLETPGGGGHGSAF